MKKAINFLFVIFILLATIVASPLKAQTIDLSKPVGTPDGEGGVSATGGASYNVPINILSGLNNVQPEVSLVYNNQGGDGVAGWGWKLSCMSMVTRSGNAYYYNNKTTAVNFRNSNDAFLLDGQRLISITGTNGGNGTVYGTENDNFSRVESFGGSETTGPDWFKVTLKNGTVMEYGHMVNTVMKTDDQASNMIWLLSKVIDRNGNYEIFTYELNQSDRTYQLSSIQYTGNETAGLTPNMTVEFLYTVRQYWGTSAKFDGGASLKDAFNLSTINVKKGGTTIRSYSLAYTQQRQLYLLKSITEKGSDGSDLNPLVFTYGSNPSAVDLSVSGVRYNNMHGGNIYAGDFNGDSKQDVLSVNYSIDNFGIRHDLSYDVLSDFSSYNGNPSVSFFYNYTIPNSTGSNVSSVNRGVGKRGPGSGTHYGYFTMDYDGDGKEDVLMVKNTTLSSGDIKFNGIDINYSRYYSVFTGAGYKTYSYNSIPHINQYSNDFVYTYRNGSTYGNNFVSGDFDGDGNLDYILILGIGPTTEFRGFFSSPKKGIFNKEIVGFQGGDGSAMSVASANQLVPMDFDGDGKQELIVMQTTKSYILSIFPISLASGYEYGSGVVGQTTAFYGDFPLFPGDFNGDGKVDVLYRNSKNSATGSWFIMTSTGNPNNPYLSTPFAWANRPYLPQDNAGSAHHILLGDLNGDKKTDIWQSLDLSSASSRHNMYFSNGTSFVIESYNAGQGNLNGSTSANTVVGDFNGDGKPDILGVNNNNQGAFIYPKPFKEELFLTKAINGLGVEQNFIYDLTNSTSGIYERSWYYEYDDPNINSLTDLRNGNPYNVLNIPMYVVGISTKSNGIGTNGLSGVSYHYKDAVFKRNRGFLGFQATRETGHATGIVSTTEQSFSYSAQVLHPTHTYSQLAGATILDTKIADTLQMENPSNYFDKRYVHKILNTISYNDVTGSASETTNTYDDYGNIITCVVKKGYMSGNSVAPLETASTQTTYGVHATPCPSLPETITVNNSRSGQADASSTLNITYDSKGNVLTKTSFAGKPKAVTTTNTYDGYGNITQSVVSANGVSSRTTKYTYDNTGRFLLGKEQIGSGVSRKTNLTYEGTFGNIASMTGSDGLTTSYTYDVFGRKIKTSLPEGYDVTETLNWENLNGRYSLTTTRPGGGSNIKVYYDLLGREVGKEVSGFNDAKLISSKTYDIRGLVTNQVNPHYANEPAVTFTNTYDNMSRLTQTTNGTVTTNYAYANLGNGLFRTTITNGAGQSSSKTEDATGKIVSAEDNGGTINYSYNSLGNQTQANVNGNVAVSSVYDEYGQQTSLTDRNAGTITYEYDALGQLTKQTDALTHATTMTYDLFGRILTRVGAEGETTYEYWKDDANGYSNDNIVKVTGFDGDIKEYSYDNLRRLSQEKVTVDGGIYTTKYTYDTYGNLTQTTYPTAIEINRVYDHNGIETQVKLGSTVLFTATAMNSLGKYTAYTTGNDKNSTESYNLSTGAPTQFLTPGIQNLTFSFDPLTGNLTQRRDELKNMQEDFTYDNLNRLLTVKANNVQTQALTYDGNNSNTLGNIATKTDAGNYTYLSGKVNAVAYITNPAGANTPPTTIPTSQQDISYTAFMKTQKVTDNNYELTYTYGSDYQRIKGILKQDGNIVETKYYLGDYEKQIKNGAVKDIVYVGFGNGLGAIIVNGAIHYIYKDYLGSILTVTNSSGIVEVNQSFDAWGRKRNPDDWSYNNIPANPDWLYRGYTGHEHLNEFALINMNGRMYDPVQGRMMSPDNYIQEPLNTQSFNRFSYCINNPLKYSDATGDWFGIDDLISGAVGGLINLGAQLISGNVHNIGQAFGYFGVGFAAGVAFEYGGPIASGIIAGAGNAWVGGGSPMDMLKGAVTGAITSALTAGIGNVVGGTGVLNGAINGAIKGIVGGAAGAAAQSLMNGNSIGETLSNIGKGIMGGAAFGSALGAVNGGIDAYVKGKNVWTGKSETTVVGSKVIVGKLTGEFVKDNNPNSWKGNISNVTYDKEGNPSFYSADVQFGANENQVYHAFRHIDEIGLDRTTVSSAITNNLALKAQYLIQGRVYNFPVDVSGQQIIYSVYKFPSGTLNVGRITK